MRAAAAALLGACFAAASAAPCAAAKLRGAVLLEGTPLAHVWVEVAPDTRPWRGADAFGGGLPHPGPSLWRTLSVDGTFETPELRPGNYAVSARFQFCSDAAIPAIPFPHRLTVGQDGSVAAYAADGRPARRLKRVELEVTPDPLPAGPVGRLRGSVRFLSDRSPDLAAHPLAIAARPLSPGLPSRAVQVRKGVFSSKGSFDFAVTAETPYILQPQSAYWGVVSVLPQEVSVEAGATVRMDIAVVPAGSVYGRVWMPDGTPYRPQSECLPDCAARHGLDLRLVPAAMPFDRPVHPDGTFRLIGVPPGVYTGEGRPRGEGFRWALPAMPGIRVEAGKAVRADLWLRDGIPVQVSTASIPGAVAPGLLSPEERPPADTGGAVPPPEAGGTSPDSR